MIDRTILSMIRTAQSRGWRAIE